MASAISYKSASVPDPLSPLQPNKTKRQLLCTYPSFELMRSMLGENGPGPFPGLFLRNRTPVMAQQSVQTSEPQSLSKSNGKPASTDRIFADLMR